MVRVLVVEREPIVRPLTRTVDLLVIRTLTLRAILNTSFPKEMLHCGTETH